MKETKDGYSYYPPVNIYPSAKIGQGTTIGMFTEIGEDVVIGERCKIGGHAFIPKGITLGNEVFVGPHVMFCNDVFPRAVGEWKCLNTIVEDGASIGANATILPGLRIGKGAMVGAGSVITQDVEPFTIVCGYQAQKKGRIGNIKVSVVVPTKNSGKFLRDCLISLQGCRQLYPDMEVIVVDNFSTDDTLEIAYEFADRVYQHGPERTAQANFGISLAKGELIYFTGSDMTRDWNFIEEAVAKIQEGYDAVYMSVLTHPRVKHFWGKVKKLERKCYVGTFIESARFFKKSAWKDLGGFSESMIGLEEDFQHRLDARGHKTGRINSREYHLHEDDSLRKVFNKAFYYGRHMRTYLKTHKKRAFSQLYPIRPNFNRFLKHPKLLIGLIIYKLVQYLGGIGGLIWN